MKTRFDPGAGSAPRPWAHLLVACSAILVFLVFISCGSKEAVQAPEVPPWYGATDFFVSSTIGRDNNTGTINSPFDKIQDAIEAAAAAGGGTVHVAEGTYRETLVLRSKVSILGGYSDVDFVRDVEADTTVISGGPTVIFGNAVDSLVIDGLTVVARNILPNEPATSSVAIHLHACSEIVISDNVITAGSVVGQHNGAGGDDGMSGLPGSGGRTGGAGGNGGSGGPGCNGGDGGSGGCSAERGYWGIQGACDGGAGGSPGEGGAFGGQSGNRGGPGEDGAGGANGPNGGDTGGGGPSIGILVGPEAGVTKTGNTFTIGNPGAGGTSGWGVDAPDGVKAEVHYL